MNAPEHGPAHSPEAAGIAPLDWHERGISRVPYRIYADPALPEAFANAKKRLRGLKEQLQYSVSAPVVKPSQGYPAEREFAKADYIAAVERAKELIAGGDFMQVQVGQRIKKRYTESPLSLYRALR